MTLDDRTPTPYYGRPAKHRVIVQAARAVFGRDGYTRAGMDVIAAEAHVSKRTIYNHFTDKENLFLSVALEGGAEVTATIETLMERHLRNIVDLEKDLVTFAMARAAAIVTFPDHFALVRALEAEVTHIPPDVVETWRAAGPQTAHVRLAPYLTAIAEQGLLQFDDAVVAANHFKMLTFCDINQRSFYGAIPLPTEEVHKSVTTGIRAFLRLYGAPADKYR